MHRSQAQSEFQSPDLQLSVALYISGQPLLRLDWKADRAFFVFADKLRCEGLIQAYWAGDLKAPAKAYFNGMRELKDRLFQAQRDRR